MAREEKPLKLKPIDESDAPTPVIRLDNRETEWKAKDPKPLRLGTHSEETETVSRRLDLPDKEEVELRTHQPGIDVLIETGTASPDLLEQNWGMAASRRAPVPWGWFALIGLVIAGAVAWSLTRLNNAEDQAKQLRIDTQSVLVDEEKEELEASLLVDRIDKTLRNFFSVGSVDDLARMVRQPERVAPLMRQYYGTKPVVPARLKTVKMLQPLTLDNRGNFWMATVLLSDGNSQSLILEIDKSGEVRIDWETLVCYQPMQWNDFVTQRPAGTSLDFRVYVERDTLYSHEFVDSNQWVSFRLTVPASEETVFGYARAGSAETEELLQLLAQNGGRRTTLILRLSIPEGLQSRRGVVIEKLVNTRWLYVDPPDAGP
jgi:hypothetical protein